MKRLRVASLITDLGFGGGENRLLSFARAVDRSRFDHIVFTLYRPDTAYVERWGSVRKGYREAGVDLVDLEQNPRERLLAAVTPNGVARAARDASSMLGRLCREIERRRVDVLDAQHITASLFGVLAGKITGVPTAVTEYHTEYWNRRGMRLPGKILLRLPEALISDSRFRLDEIDRWLIAPHPRPVVIPNGIPEPIATISRESVLERLGIPAHPRVRVVAQVSRLVPYKGHRTLLRAAPRILARHRDVYLLCVGYAGAEPAYRDELLAFADSLGISDRVRIAGYPGPIGDVWQTIDVHVHASSFDSSPIAIAEAMASSKPSVVTSVGGIPELVEHERTGLVVPPDDPARLADAVVRLLEESETAERLARAARLRYEARHTPERMARALESLFVELAGQRRAA